MHSPFAVRVFPALCFVVAASWVSSLWAAPDAAPKEVEKSSFAVVVYNVENLHDIDGVAAYEEFKGDKYTPAHLLVKITNIAKILAKVDKGAGPAIAMFNEIELDQTPDSTVTDYDGWVSALADQPLASLLSGAPVPPKLAGAPAEAWLLKACVEAGLTGYHVAVTDERSGSVRNVLFSRFPVKAVRSHPTKDARAILEVELDVEGYPLTVFVNHWKSMRGKDPSDTEDARRQNARVLRDRIDALLLADPNHDILVGGDLNSHYNHKQRERALRGNSAINDVLGSQGNELAVRGKQRDLYNLWFELPSDQRASEEFDGVWGTLMNFIISRGLYDLRGVQYVDNSFAVLRFPGMNVNAKGLPNAFSRGKVPYGFSDHFPIYARFTVATENTADKWMPLSRPSRSENGPSALVPAEIATSSLFATAAKLSELPKDVNLFDGTHDGKIFYVETEAYVNDRGFVKMKLGDTELDIFSRNKKFRDDLAKRVAANPKIRFYGELGQYQKRWQFMLWGPEWLK